MDVLGVDHIDLTVNDLARSAPFYEKVLGALGFRRVPHATYLVWANAHLAIGLRAAGARRARGGVRPLPGRAPPLRAPRPAPGRGGSRPRPPPSRRDHGPRSAGGIPRVRPAVLRGLLRRSRRDEARGRPLPVGVLAQGPERGGR